MSELLVDGFFPRCEVDRPARAAAGLRLPRNRPAVRVRHGRHAAPGGVSCRPTATTPGEPVRPTHVLFNGGVFKADALRAAAAGRAGRVVRRRRSRRRLLGRRARPGPCRGPRRGLLRLGQAPRRRADPRRHGPGVLRGHRDRRPGRARGAAAAAGAVRRADRHGRRHRDRRARRDEIGLVVGEPAQFRFFSSSTRKQDRPGDVLSSWTADELAETDSLETALPADESLEEDYVPVRFHSHVTELGVLELWCVSAKPTGAGNWNSASAKTPNKHRIEFRKFALQPRCAADGFHCHPAVLTVGNAASRSVPATLYYGRRCRFPLAGDSGSIRTLGVGVPGADFRHPGGDLLGGFQRIVEIIMPTGPADHHVVQMHGPFVLAIMLDHFPAHRRRQNAAFDAVDLAGAMSTLAVGMLTPCPSRHRPRKSGHGTILKFSQSGSSAVLQGGVFLPKCLTTRSTTCSPISR